MDTRSIKRKYIEFFKSENGSLTMINFHELNGQDPLQTIPKSSTAYRLFETTDRVNPQGESLRSWRTDQDIIYIKSSR